MLRGAARRGAEWSGAELGSRAGGRMAGKSTVLDGYDYKNLQSMIQRFKALPVKKEIIEAFVDLDTNHSGRISRTELRNGLASKFQVHVTEAEMDSLFKHIDKTGVSDRRRAAPRARAPPALD